MVRQLEFHEGTNRMIPQEEICLQVLSFRVDRQPGAQPCEKGADVAAVRGFVVVLPEEEVFLTERNPDPESKLFVRVVDRDLQQTSYKEKPFGDHATVRGQEDITFAFIFGNVPIGRWPIDMKRRDSRVFLTALSTPETWHRGTSINGWKQSA